MTAVNELIKKMNTFIKEEIEENRLALVVDDEITELPEELELIKIESSFVESEDKTNEYHIYINTFRLGDKEIYIDVFAEDTHLEDEVYLRDSYKIYWDSFNGSSLDPKESYQYVPMDDYGVTKLLNAINYSEVFNDDGGLLVQVCNERHEIQGAELFEKAKGVFSDLVAIEVGGYGYADMIFESGAVLSVEMDNIYRAIEKANQKKAEKQHS